MFEGWGEFYVILGAGSGALLGLLFVVTTLAAGMRLGRDTLTLGSALYMTPTVFHFTTVLVFSAIATAPHLSGWVMALVLGPWALAGTVYSCVMAVLVRTRRLPDSGTWTDVWTFGQPQRASCDRHRHGGADDHRHQECVGLGDVYCAAER
jgi:hypothetical protein